MASIIVHGGAGSVPEDLRRERRPVLDQAAEAGLSRLESGKKAIGAVEEAVRVLEDNPLFNAGTGSVLTIAGTVEMDAAIMDSDGNSGAVTGLKKVKNPISAARLVMEETDHILLAGNGLDRFRADFDLSEHDPVTDRRREKWKELLNALEENGYDVSSIPNAREWGRCKSIVRDVLKDQEEVEQQGTVGAVAADEGGRLAAATSTGGTSYKLPGRVGDTPIIGAGTYVTDHGAVSATGDGEDILRVVLAKQAADYMKEYPAEEATEKAIEYASKHDASCGLITMDHRGRPGADFNTEMMDTVSKKTS